MRCQCQETLLKDTAMQTDGNWSEMAAEKLRQEKKKKRRAASAKEPWFFQRRGPGPLCRLVVWGTNSTLIAIFKCNGFQKQWFSLSLRFFLKNGWFLWGIDHTPLAGSFLGDLRGVSQNSFNNTSYKYGKILKHLQIVILNVITTHPCSGRNGSATANTCCQFYTHRQIERHLESKWYGENPWLIHGSLLLYTNQVFPHKKSGWGGNL